MRYRYVDKDFYKNIVYKKIFDSFSKSFEGLRFFTAIKK